MWTNSPAAASENMCSIDRLSIELQSFMSKSKHSIKLSWFNLILLKWVNYQKELKFITYFTFNLARNAMSNDIDVCCHVEACVGSPANG